MHFPGTTTAYRNHRDAMDLITQAGRRKSEVTIRSLDADTACTLGFQSLFVCHDNVLEIRIAQATSTPNAANVAHISCLEIKADRQSLAHLPAELEKHGSFNSVWEAAFVSLSFYGADWGIGREQIVLSHLRPGRKIFIAMRTKNFFDGGYVLICAADQIS